MKRVLLSGLLGCLLLAGCGGGSESTPKPTVTGVLYDSAVQGVDYACSGGRSGTTNGAGEFTCDEGDSVAFSVGGIALGEVPAAARVTVFDLAGAAQPDIRQLQEYIGEKTIGDPFVRRAFSNGDASLHRSLNISLLLQTLDEDRNPENGIEITADTATRLAGATCRLNFSKDQYEFTERLRKVLAQSGIARPPCKPLEMVRHLVSSGVIPGPFKQPVTYEFDDFDDGTIDRIIDLTFDASGNLSGAGQYRPDVGSYDYVQSFNCNSKGYITSALTFVDFGPENDLQSFTYDADGNILRYEQDNQNDGTLDAIGVYVYDPLGNRTRAERDYNGSGQSVKTENAFYDASGNQVRLEADQDGDGVTDWVERHSYDANGNRIRSEYDYFGDGVVDTIELNSFNSAGDLVRSEFDNGADGTIDWVGTWTYDSYGNLLSAEGDNGADGTIDSSETYAYDVSGRLIRWEYDNPIDGAGSIVSTYDPSGGMVRRHERNSFWTSTPDSVEVKSYDADGSLVSYQISGTNVYPYIYRVAYETVGHYPQWNYFPAPIAWP